MPTTYKVLAQVNPAITTATTFYTVPSSTSTVVSTIVVCNIGSWPTTYRIAVRPSAATLENKHYVVFDSSIDAQDTQTYTIGMTLTATDVVTVYAGSGNIVFNLFGSEIS
jgi:hypothetical protein